MSTDSINDNSVFDKLALSRRLVELLDTSAEEIPMPNEDTWDICEPVVKGLDNRKPIYTMGVGPYKENGGGSLTIFKNDIIVETKELEKTEVKEDLSKLDLIGLSIDGRTFTVKDTLELETFIEIKTLINEEGVVLKALYEKEQEEVIDKSSAFHIASMLLNFMKKKKYLLEVSKKMKIHNDNKKANAESKIAKRRNKKKLNKKFKK